MLPASRCLRYTTASLRQLIPHRSPTLHHARPYSMSTTLPTITMNPNEQRLARLLVGCADWVDQHPEEVDQLRLQDEAGHWIGKVRGSEKVELRIAGGWVRDKLLGRESNDIDVSTSPDPITGLKFATLFEKYLASVGQRDLMGKLTKIEAKPEQSKHLETATAMVCDLSVDWVQQRGQEVYTEGSRIPTVAFGTPLEDAERRDLTINALFYNLRTEQIEDQTGKGLADLGLVPGQQKRIRTPLEPFRTFHDDPLRVVRAVRFAARFGREFILNDDLVKAIEREEIRATLRDPKKISRERVGIELDKMLLGRDPLYAMELIDRLQLHPLIFLYDPQGVTSISNPGSPPAPPDPSSSLLAARVVSDLLHESQPHLHPLLQFSVVPPPTDPSVSLYPSSTDLNKVYPVTIKRFYLASGLLPLRDLELVEKKKTFWIGEKVVKDGIKGPTSDWVWVRKAREAHLLLSAGVEKLAGVGVEPEEADRAELGLLLRNLSVHDSLHSRWNVSLFWSLVVDIVDAGADPTKAHVLIKSYNRLIERVLEFGLDTRAFEQPLLDGKRVNELIPSTKNSPAMTSIISLVVEFQLANPTAVKADAEQWLLSEETSQKVQDLLVKFVKPPFVKKKKGQQ